MTAAHEHHTPVQTEDPQDRLIDVALAELIGRSAPPDLTSRIIAANETRQVTRSQPAAPRDYSRRFKWISIAVAATLLIGFTTVFYSPWQYREASVAHGKFSRSTGKKDRLNADRPLSLSKSESLKQQATNTPTLATPGTDPNTFAMIIEGQEAKLRYNSEQTEPTTEAEELSVISRSIDEIAPKAAVERTAAGVPIQTPGIVRAQSPTPATPMPGAVPAEEAVAATSAGDHFHSYFEQAASQPTPLYRYTSETYQFGVYVPPGQATRAWPKEVGGTAEGRGPGLSGDQYTRIFENPFIKAEGGAAVSTFSIDVDTASYSNVRQFLMEMNQLPPADAVRIEELVNYFQYDYEPPTSASDDAPPFAAHVEVSGCPWNADHRLARIAVKGREMDRTNRPQSNLVFLVDVSGSMDEPNKLPLVVYGLQQLTRELGENDRVALVVYASSEGLVLPSTTGDKQDAIQSALGKLKAGGSTAGGAGIQLAYQLAEDHFIKDGTNRVILCTDGDFNVGVTSPAELERLVERKAKDTGVFLSVLGFGRGNLNDAMMEAIADHGNGNYSYVDNRTEARRVLVEQLTGTLVTIAKDVKIQVEFNPAKVAGYRLIGYENRMLRTEDFNDDKKDAGEIGAGHTVTALYEIVPAGKKVDVVSADDLKYQQPVGRTIPTDQNEAESTTSEGTDKIVRPTDNPSAELLTLKMRYKAPEGDTSKKLEWPVTDAGKSFNEATDDFQFAAAVAGFGMLLRDSQHKGNLTYAADLELAQTGLGRDEHGYRAEFLELVKRAKQLKGE